MNIFLLDPSTRILEWRKFRLSLKDKTEIEQLEAVAKFWSNAPLQTYSIDYDNPSSWPTPWELIHEGGLCRTAIAYLMEQTLLMAGWSAERVQLNFIKDNELQDQMMVVMIDDKWVLNFSIGQVFNFDNHRDTSAVLLKYKTTENGHVEV